jgi:hypothetical protein
MKEQAAKAFLCVLHRAVLPLRGESSSLYLLSLENSAKLPQFGFLSSAF